MTSCRLLIFALTIAGARADCAGAIHDILTDCSRQAGADGVALPQCINAKPHELHEAGCNDANFRESAMAARERFEKGGGKIAGDEFVRPKSLFNRIFLDKNTDVRLFALIFACTPPA